MNALMRTTCCFTMMEGSRAANAIPTEAHMTANLRLSPRDTMETAETYLRRTIGDADVSLRRIQGTDPSPFPDRNPGMGTSSRRRAGDMAGGDRLSVYDGRVQRLPPFLPNF